jgi:mandelate racemase
MIAAQARADVKVGAIRTRVVRVPLARPLIARAVQVHRVSFVLVDFETDAGLSGHAYLHAFPDAAAGIYKTLIDVTAGLLVGQALAPSSLYDLAMRSVGLWVGKEGLFATALAGIDMAAWDALAKVNAVPLAQLLGGEARELRAYNSTGLGLMPPAQLAREALELLAGGFTAVKMRLGNPTLAEDLAAVRAVRGAVPAGVSVMSDLGQALAGDEGFERCRALDGEGLTWIEDPIGYDDIAGHARIAAAIDTPLQTGENFYGPDAAARAIAARVSDYVNFDLGHIGGVTGWLRAAAHATAARLPVSSHVYPEFSAQLLAATPTAHWLEYFDWAVPLLRQPLEVVDGNAVVAQRPGAGIEWNEEALRRYAL